MEIILTVLILAALYISTRMIVQEIRELKTAVENQPKYATPRPTKNEIVEETPNMVELNEHYPMTVPGDVKVDVEGDYVDPYGNSNGKVKV
jgi:hypothetical protein